MRAWLNTNTDDIIGVFYGEGAWLTTGGGQIDNGKVMGGVSTLVPTHARTHTTEATLPIQSSGDIADSM